MFHESASCRNTNVSESQRRQILGSVLPSVTFKLLGWVICGWRPQHVWMTSRFDIPSRIGKKTWYVGCANKTLAVTWRLQQQEVPNTHMCFNGWAMPPSRRLDKHFDSIPPELIILEQCIEKLLMSAQMGASFGVFIHFCDDRTLANRSITNFLAERWRKNSFQNW